MTEGERAGMTEGERAGIVNVHSFVDGMRG